MRHCCILFFLNICSLSICQDKVELKIYGYSLSGNTLTLQYCFKNNTSTMRSVYVGAGWSTIPELLNFTLLIFENDTLPLHEGNPFGGYPSMKCDAIEPHGINNGVIQIDLNNLYKNDCILFRCPPHQISGRCSFQLIYYDRLYPNMKDKSMYKAYLNGRRIKRHTPVLDTLRSNIIYIDKHW